MAETASTMLELGSILPEFQLQDTRDPSRVVASADFANQAFLVMFICNHCPYVIHILERMTELANYFQRKGIAAVAISANDVENYPQDGPQAMQALADDSGFEFPYLYDQSQEVAKAFTAACTPDFFLYDASHRLVYRGQMDDSRPNNAKAVSGSDLEQAMHALVTGKAITKQQVPSVGCNIKWKAGKQPEYF